MRNLGRMWSIDSLGPAVDRLIDVVESGMDTTRPEPESEKIVAVIDAARHATWTAIRSKYKAAELERLVVPLLRAIYHMGASSIGADPRSKAPM
jgi:hypothetical protein